MSLKAILISDYKQRSLTFYDYKHETMINNDVCLPLRYVEHLDQVWVLCWGTKQDVGSKTLQVNPTGDILPSFDSVEIELLPN